jgi:hypothetical protein
MSRRRVLALLAATPLLWLLPALRNPMEASMVLHMLVQIPLLLLAGWAAAAWLPQRCVALLAQADPLGLLGATLAACMLAYWMVPAALDLAVLDGRFALAKYLGLWLAGLGFALGWPRLGAVLAAFVLGNMAWMMATAGLLYREAEARLCVSYLFDEQALAGAGLIAWGLVALAAAVARARGGAPSEPCPPVRLHRARSSPPGR